MSTGRVGRALALGAALVVACAGALLLLYDPAPAPVRVLLVGDSVTQGSSGDWTWRYRLWQQLTASGVDVDLVGPRDDLLDLEAAAFGSQQYVDRDFDRDHAARWGMSLAEPDQPIDDLVREYRPDVVVELLGVNDLAWGYEPPSEVQEDLARFVEDAREADPAVDLVLCALPQVWLPGVTELNAGLPGLAERLDTDSSRVVTAASGEGFVEGVDTYDSAHLSATGEVRVAAAVTDALAGLGTGRPYPRPLPDVPDGPRDTALLTARPADRAAQLAWHSPPGATGAYIWIRDRSTGEPWTRLPWLVTETSWTVGGLVNDHDYEFRLQSAKGSSVAEDLYSNVAAARPSTEVLPGLPSPAPPVSAGPSAPSTASP